MARQENGEDEQHHYTACINRNLHCAEKLIIELKVDGGGGKEGEQQVGGGAQNLARRDSKHRADDNRQSDYHINDDTSYGFHILYYFFL